MNAKNKTKQNDNCCGSQHVRLELMHATAQEVCIAGSFNDWHPGATPMIRLNDGKWAKELSLTPGHYEYRFVVDGEWVNDPAATELIPNPFGTANAVLLVTAPKPVAPASPGNAAPSTRPQTKKTKPSAQREADMVSKIRGANETNNAVVPPRV